MTKCKFSARTTAEVFHFRFQSLCEPFMNVFRENLFIIFQQHFRRIFFATEHIKEFFLSFTFMWICLKSETRNDAKWCEAKKWKAARKLSQCTWITQKQNFFFLSYACDFFVLRRSVKWKWKAGKRERERERAEVLIGFLFKPTLSY